MDSYMNGVDLFIPILGFSKWEVVCSVEMSVRW